MLRRRPDPVVTRTGAALFGILIALGAAALVVPFLPEGDEFHEGDVAPRALAAANDRQYISESLTEEARAAAAAAVDPATAPLPTLRDDQLALLASLFEEVTQIRSNEGLSAGEQLAVLAEVPGSEGLGPAIRSTLLSLAAANFEDLRATAAEGVSVILASPVLSEDQRSRIEAYLLVGNVPSFINGEGALRELLATFVVANVEIDEEATRVRQDEARAAVDPVIVTYSAGQVLVAEGQQLDAALIEALLETGVIEEGFDFGDLGAGFLIAGSLGTALGVYLYRLQPFAQPAERRVLMTLVAVLGTLLAVRLALPALLPDDEARFYPYAIPVAVAAVVVASVSAPRFGAVVAIGVALFAGFIATTTPDLAGAEFTSTLEPLELVMAYAAGGLAGAAAIQRTERLGRFAFAGLAVGVATGAVLLAFWFLTEQRSNESLGWLSAAATLTGAGAAVLGLGVHVLLSLALGVTTRMQLMALAQSGHPLLLRLQDQAPGTYHHSMMVATLAEQAANRVGADALLVRAGAYYHDIGKLQQPEYFIENNIERGSSAHDGLPPEESARLIQQHVTGGIDLARKSRLPAIVRDFIPQHHGTRLVTYFYRQASAEGEVDPEAFRYPGPRPQEKEHAIVMLADSCEAVVRAGQPDTNEDMDELVNAVFAERLAEGQLDECDITMRELQDVAASFRATLRAVYHPRIEYRAAVGIEASDVASS